MSAAQTVSSEVCMRCDPNFLFVCLHISDRFCIIAGTGKVSKVKKGTWLDQTKIRQELGRKPLSAHQQRQLAHTAAGGSCPVPVCTSFVFTGNCFKTLAGRWQSGPLAFAFIDDIMFPRSRAQRLSWSGPE